MINTADPSDVLVRLPRGSPSSGKKGHLLSMAAQVFQDHGAPAFDNLFPENTPPAPEKFCLEAADLTAPWHLLPL